MNLQTVPRKPLFIALGVLVIGIVAFLIANPILSEHFKTVYPTLEVHFPKNFSSEKTLSLTGSVLAECNCELNLTVEGEKVDVTPEGTFEYSIPVGQESERKVTVQAQTKGIFWDSSTQTNIVTETIRRANAPIKVEAPSDSSEKSNNISLQTIPAAKIKVTGYYNREVETKSNSPVMDPISIEADSSGNATLSLPFENSAITKSSTYRVRIEAPDYIASESVFTISNKLYDSSQVEKEKEKLRLAEEARVKQEAEAKEATRKKTIADEMGKYEGSGFIQIAIATNGIQKSRSIGYYSVSDSNKHQFIKVPVVVRNVGYTSEHVNPLYFTIVDSSGRTYNTDSATYSLGGNLEATTLQADTRTDGWLAFIVPKSEQELTLVYSDGFGEIIKKQIIVQ